MSRLFVRLWLGLVGLFVVAMGVHELLFHLSLSDAEQAYENAWVSPGFRLAIGALREADDGPARSAVVEELAWAFRTDVRVVDAEALDGAARAALRADGEAYELGLEGLTVTLPVDAAVTEAMVVGPMPLPPVPDPWSRGWLLLVTALAFGGAVRLALRPLDAQHERMARALADMVEGRPPAAVGPGPAPVAAFDALAAQLDATVAGQRQVLRAASHELRTPLARLRLGIQLLALTDDASTREAKREALDGDIAELDDLVEELLVYARARGVVMPARVAVRVGDRATARWARLGGTADELTVEDGVVMADPAQLDRVLDNLLGNARKHGAGRVWVSVRSVDGGAELCVEDDGPGLGEADAGALLQPFVRGDHDTRGHGLGLAIVAEVMRAHGGDVALGHGATGGLRVVLRWPVGTVGDKEPSMATGS